MTENDAADSTPRHAATSPWPGLALLMCQPHRDEKSMQFVRTNFRTELTSFKQKGNVK